MSDLNTSISSNNNGTSDSSAIDSDDIIEPPRRRKRYKQALNLDYKPHQVSSLTRRRWNNPSLQQVLNKTAVTPSASGILEESADVDYCTLFKNNIKDNKQSGSLRELTEKTNKNSLETTHKNENVTANHSRTLQTGTMEECDEYSNDIRKSLNEICDINHLLHDDIPRDDQVLENESRRVYSPHESNLMESDSNLHENEPYFVDSPHESDIEYDCNMYEVRNDNDCSLDDKSDNDSSIDESDDDFNENDKNTFFNQIMFEASNMTVFDILLMVTAFSLRFHLSDEAKLELIKMIKTKLKDVNDGALHKKIMKSFNNTKELEFMLTLNFNTDGAPLNKSGKRGFWPVQGILNNLSPKLRFQFVILAGVLIVEKEPKSNLLDLYLNKVFVEHMHLFCTVDSVCRPIVQWRLQFNGYCGCSWCYILGKYIQSAHGIRYTVELDDPIRTNESHQEDVRKALDTGVSVRGVHGLSCLSNLPNFDMVWSFAYEYMHGMLLGVTYQIWTEWKTGESGFQINKKQVEFIEARYLNITPTQDVHRLPRKGIIQGTAKPKASELKSWLLFFSLPCLDGIIAQEALDHYY
ncbi:hypothetical protein TSAR_011695 [Trichomalopsis sarcophagae]|uniref:Uncharacterized protein n=1 Tax=Trichomalopsis sarcophagae TaxID=543379 RepID=A0A232EKZ1_9HYME|nr:hypothetical protein TSAR_011695 [Trichomalopsis sarcophagae]